MDTGRGLQDTNMTMTEAYQLACSRGHQKEFCESVYSFLNGRMSEQEAIAAALSKISSIQSSNNVMIAKSAYAMAFQKAIENGHDENSARMIALQSVPRRKG